MNDTTAKKPLRIHIDRTPYEVAEHQLTGTQLRELPNPPIAADFDLWLEERGDVEDELVVPTEPLKLKQDMHFYSAPTKINPGQC